MTERRHRMVKAKKAPNVLTCTKQEWTDHWLDPIKSHPNRKPKEGRS